MAKIKETLKEELGIQAVKIVRLKCKLAEANARSGRLHEWWQDEEKRANRLEEQSQAQDARIAELQEQRSCWSEAQENRIAELKKAQDSWELERATLLRQIADLQNILDTWNAKPVNADESN